MKLGFLTACMGDRRLEEIVPWAAAHEFDALELAAWPDALRSHTAAHLDVTDAESVDATGELLGTHGVQASALAFYANQLDHRAEVRAAHHEHLHRCIDAASALGIPAVGTFIGRNPARSVAESLREAEEIFPRLSEYAGERGVTLMIENCVMAEWDPDHQVGNLAHTPELWEWMSGLGLGLNFDPSHLVWQGIDATVALRGALPFVRHVHAKDIEVFPDRRNLTGWGPSLLNGGEPHWWRFRMPGMGAVDWSAVLGVLHEARYDGTVSIEHEDPVWDGSPDRVEAGLKFGRATLARQLPEAL
jgi:sugar phosphate isomerase/epimerase